MQVAQADDHAPALLDWYGAHGSVRHDTSPPPRTRNTCGGLIQSQAVAWRRNAMFHAPQHTGDPSHAVVDMLSTCPEMPTSPFHIQPPSLPTDVSCPTTSTLFPSGSIASPSLPTTCTNPTSAKTWGAAGEVTPSPQAILAMMRASSDGAKALTPCTVPAAVGRPHTGSTRRAGTLERSSSHREAKVAAASGVISFVNSMLSRAENRGRQQQQQQNSLPTAAAAAGMAHRAGGAAGGDRTSPLGGLGQRAVSHRSIRPQLSAKELHLGATQPAFLITCASGTSTPSPGQSRSPAPCAGSDVQPVPVKGHKLSGQPLSGGGAGHEGAERHSGGSRVSPPSGARVSPLGAPVNGAPGPGACKATPARRLAAQMHLARTRSEGARSFAPLVRSASTQQGEEARLGHRGSDGDGRRGGRGATIAANTVIQLTRGLVSASCSNRSSSSFTRASSDRDGRGTLRPSGLSDQVRVPAVAGQEHVASGADAALQGRASHPQAQSEHQPLDVDVTAYIPEALQAGAAAQRGAAGLLAGPPNLDDAQTGGSTQQQVTHAHAEPSCATLSTLAVARTSYGRPSGTHVARPSRLSLAVRGDSTDGRHVSHDTPREAPTSPGLSHGVAPTTFMRRSKSYSGGSPAAAIGAEEGFNLADALERVSSGSQDRFTGTSAAKHSQPPEGARLECRVPPAGGSPAGLVDSASGRGSKSAGRRASMLKQVWQGLGIKAWFRQTSSPRMAKKGASHPPGRYLAEGDSSNAVELAGGGTGSGGDGRGTAGRAVDCVAQGKQNKPDIHGAIQEGVRSMLGLTRALLPDSKAKSAQDHSKKQQPASVRW